MYLANHCVRIGSAMFKRGERIPDNLPKDKIKWLLSAGAIKEVAPASLGEPEEEPEETGDAAEDAEDAAQEKEEGVEPETDTIPEEEADDEAEAPEIDVMSGIVGGAEDEPKKTARHQSAKKQTGRRK